MKLVRFGPPGLERPGVWLEKADRSPAIMDVRAMAYDIDDYDSRFFVNHGLDRVEALTREPNPILVPSASVRLGPPLVCSGAVICLGKNYRAHVEEFDAQMPDRPILFSKAPQSIQGAFDPIRIPPDATEVDGEVELAAVIGKPARQVDPDGALAYIAGYTVLNDVTDRAAQRGDGQWFRAKSADTFCPLGPFLVTVDDAGHQPRRLYSQLNGACLQEGSTDQMLFDLPTIIAFVSRSITLQPGDIISTGTPAGIGSARTPPVFLKAGDTLETVVAGIGHQTCRIEAV